MYARQWQNPISLFESVYYLVYFDVIFRQFHSISSHLFSSLDKNFYDFFYPMYIQTPKYQTNIANAKQKVIDIRSKM